MDGLARLVGSYIMFYFVGSTLISPAGPVMLSASLQNSLSELVIHFCVDFFSVSLSVTSLAKQFDRDTTDITQAITLTLLFRSLGAVIFGILSDRYGRKYPLVFNLLLVSVLELGAGFTQTYSQFLAVRSLFGIGMGGKC